MNTNRCLARIGILPALLAVALAPAAVTAAEPTATISLKSLTMETALAIARGAITSCREKGAQVAVVVVDRGGHPQVVLRDVLVPDFALRASEQKAYTAMTFSTATSGLAAQFPEPHSVAKIEGMLPAPGGVPVLAAGSTVGGVGVSGAPTGEMDEACAKAGVEAVAFELEEG